VAHIHAHIKGSPMPKVLLTDRFVRTAKPRPGERQTEFFDEATKGFSLVASAGARTFYLTYTRPGDRKRARMWLGTFPEISLADARQKARDARVTVSEGNDPHADRRAEETAQRVRDLVENYIARRAAAQRSCKEIARRLRKNVAGVIGDLKLSELHRRDLTRCIDLVKDRGAPIEANRVFQDLRAMIRWARGRGDLDHNLMEGMQPPSDAVTRDRVLTPDEIRTFWTKLAGAVMEEGTRRILRLCLVTSARVGEVAGLVASELDLERQVWKIPAARSKNKLEHLLPLSDLAIEIIKHQIADTRKAAAMREQRLAGRIARRVGNVPVAEASTSAQPEWIFPGPGAIAPITVYGVVGAIARNRAHFGIEPFTSHDLRRTAATRMGKLGVLPFVVSCVLGHLSVIKHTVTDKHYNLNQYLREQRTAVALWEAHLRGIIDGAATADVLPLFERARP
jgi:integrase